MDRTVTALFTHSERHRQVMSVSALTETYLNHPFPIWSVNVAQALVDDRWQILAQSSQWTPRNYNTGGLLAGGFIGFARKNENFIRQQGSKYLY